MIECLVDRHRHAGTLISAMLLLMRQHWRASINRLAEAMTLFAAGIAGLFPIMHLGRPLSFYWLVPYPNTMAVWPQWRSALIWDFWAILSHIFSILFSYIGLIPALACMRDRAKSKSARFWFGAFAKLTVPRIAVDIDVGERPAACLSSQPRAPCSVPSHNVAIFRRRGRRLAWRRAGLFEPVPVLRSDPTSPRRQCSMGCGRSGKGVRAKSGLDAMMVAQARS